MPTYGNILAWEFEKDGVEGKMVFNNIAMRLDAVRRGLGLAHMPDDLVAIAVSAQGNRSCAPGLVLRSVGLEADHHRVRPQQRLDACGHETGVAHPGLAVGAGVVEASAGLDQHVQTHQ